jgi:hypothetical protein
MSIAYLNITCRARDHLWFVYSRLKPYFVTHTFMSGTGVLRSGSSLVILTCFLILAFVFSFVVHFLLTHPESMSKLRAEVDEVIADRVVTLEDITKMPYLTGTVALPLFDLRLRAPCSGHS